MSWLFVIWLICFVLQAALLGIVMYTLICLSDLENDFINPHDSTTRVNRWVVPELLIQATLTALLVFSGKWFSGLLHVAVFAYHVRGYLRQELYADVTEIFKELTEQKKRRLIKLAIFLAAFVLIIYRLVETAVTALLTPAGRRVAKQILSEAATVLH